MNSPQSLTYCLDWLAFTTKIIKVHEAKDLIAFWNQLNDAWVSTRATNGYTFAIRHATGLILQWGEPWLGVWCIASGDALRKLETIGIDSDAMMGIVQAMSANVTRIDLAIDARNFGGHSASWFASEIEAGDYKSAAQGYSVIRSSTGTTAYLGSRTSERFLRIYDKGKQMGLEERWTRIELELKGDKAKICASAIKEYGLKSVVGSWVRDFATFHCPLWNAIEDGLKPGAVGRKATDTVKWLIETCARSLAKEAMLDEAIVDLFFQEYQAERERLQKG